MSISPQIPLPLEPLRSDRFEDFVPGPNAQALAAIRQLLDEPGGVAFVAGPPGSGKSHLLNAFCHAARARDMTAFYVPLKHMPAGASAGLRGLQDVDAVCVDDLDFVAGDPDWERDLFGCFNEVRSAGGRLLVSSRAALASLPLGLPDLASRLAWGLRLSLQPPDEAGKREILRQRARAMKIDMPDDVANYLLRYGRRDTTSLLAALERLRQAAFAGKRRITIPLAREVLEQLLEETSRTADSGGRG